MGETIDIGKGRGISSGIICLYSLPTGMMLYCECATEDDGGYTFPTERTLVVMTSPGPKGSTNYQMMKAAATFGYPTKIKLSKIGVLASDCTDVEITRKAKATLSGLVLPPGAGN
jgi:hypothetical protein